MNLVAGSDDTYLTVAGGRHLAYGQLDSTCEVAAVDPATLRTSSARRFACEACPPGRHVVAVQGPVGGGRDEDNGKHNAQVRIGRVSESTGRMTLGPVVMTFGDYSDTHLEEVYGGSSLWVYDCNTTHGSALLRISALPGAVQGRVPMPDVCRTVIAATATSPVLVAKTA